MVRVPSMFSFLVAVCGPGYCFFARCGRCELLLPPPARRERHRCQGRGSARCDAEAELLTDFDEPVQCVLCACGVRAIVVSWSVCACFVNCVYRCIFSCLFSRAYAGSNCQALWRDWMREFSCRLIFFLLFLCCRVLHVRCKTRVRMRAGPCSMRGLLLFGC